MDQLSWPRAPARPAVEPPPVRAPAPHLAAALARHPAPRPRVRRQVLPEPPAAPPGQAQRVEQQAARPVVEPARQRPLALSEARGRALAQASTCRVNSGPKL